MTTYLTLRSVKGTPLTVAEGDENFTNLRTTADAKAQAAAIGIATTADDLGTFTGATIADASSVKTALQALETASEAVTATAATKANASALGVTASAADMGTFTGATIPDTQTAKQAIQALETAFEAEPAAVRTLTNKTVNLTSNTLSGTVAQFNTALSDGDFATIAGTETLTGKTLTTPILSGTASGTGAGSLGYLAGVLSYGNGSVQRTVANLDEAQTFTNKTLTSPVLTTPTINSASVATISGTAPLYMARAWVNFNGTGTPAVTSGKNVTSITDGGVGVYTVNITTAMPDANYPFVGFCRSNVASGASVYSIATHSSSSKSTSALEVHTRSVSSTAEAFFDSAEVNIVIF